MHERNRKVIKRSFLEVMPNAGDDLPEPWRPMLAAIIGAFQGQDLDPAPGGNYEVASTMPPVHYEQAVARAVERITGGELEKVVLAREVEVHAPAAHDPAAVLGLLREAFPTSFVYAVGRGDATLIGATPELLIRRQGQRAVSRRVQPCGDLRELGRRPAVDERTGVGVAAKECCVLFGGVAGKGAQLLVDVGAPFEPVL